MVQLSDLMGAEVRTTDGERLGRVNDVRVACRPDGTWAVDALLLGSASFLERLGLRSTTPDQIAWTRVSEIDQGAIVVR
jgi:sporulation protein YlmC with PRC-barrel domain